MFTTIKDKTLYERAAVRRKNHAARAMVALGLCAMLASCGSTPVVDKTRYTRVETQIADAKEIKASQYAGGELFAAQDKLKDARAAEEAGNREKAVRLIKEAGLHAQLAESRALSARAQKSLDGINKGLATLENEINR